MFDDLLWKLFPPGGDVLACVTQAILWLGALACLAAAILFGVIDTITRRTRPAPALIRAHVAAPECAVPMRRHDRA